MKPCDRRIFFVVTTCLCYVLFLSGCATPKMEGQLLKQCILRGDSEGAVKLISNWGVDSKDNDAVYGDYLFYAAQKNDTNVMLALFARGADIHHKQPSIGPEASRTAIHAAAQHRSAEALRMLLDRGGDPMKRDGRMLTPFDLSVVEFETPGTVTDMLIQAGAKPQKENHSKAIEGGVHWATASYQERHGDTSGAVVHYQKAAESYERASRDILGSERFMQFLNSPFMRSALVVGNFALGSAVNSPTGVAVNNVSSGSTPFDPLDPKRVEAVKGNIASLHDKAERYAAYSKLLRDHAKELADQVKQ